MSFRKDIILSADAACNFNLPAFKLAQVLNPIWIRVLTAQHSSESALSAQHPSCS